MPRIFENKEKCNAQFICFCTAIISFSIWLMTIPLLSASMGIVGMNLYQLMKTKTDSSLSIGELTNYDLLNFFAISAVLMSCVIGCIVSIFNVKKIEYFIFFLWLLILIGAYMNIYYPGFI